MCRLIALTSDQYLSPMDAVNGLNAMHEGYDGSGMGLFLRDLGGPFEFMKDAPVLSGIFSCKGLKRLDRFMLQTGFTTKYKSTFSIPATSPHGTPRRDVYLVRAYETPPEYETLSTEDRHQKYMQLRLELKQMGDTGDDMMVFSFWPDTIVLKEIGDPLTLAQYLDLGRAELQARVIMAQGRQNTNYAIDLYACHPFFLQGFATMTNGENTAFISNREFLSSRGFCGYCGYQSDSEVFTHSLHYTMTRLGLGLAAYKHVITPLDAELLENHPDTDFLTYLKYTCRHLIIDGPNCVVGCLPDNTLFMVQDRKKLRPGVVGGKPGKYGFASEVCGLDAALAERDCDRDYQPMHLETVAVSADRRGLDIYRQTDALLAN
jgi:glutamate synthase domain-containing protein 1